MSTYNYPRLIAKACAELPNVEGQVLVDALVQTIDPEYNQVWLVFEDSTYVIYGRVGSEYLGIERGDVPTGEEPEGVRIERHEPFTRFIGRRLLQARMIGEAWNGHGFEFTFEGLTDYSMLIQSIYSSPKPDRAEDCLRLGVGHYSCGTDDAV
jgi:hypothetical protein